MAAARLPVFPTRQNLQVMKVKLTGAKKGHSLLKKKADALSMRLRALLKNILEVRSHTAGSRGAPFYISRRAPSRARAGQRPNGRRI